MKHLSLYKDFLSLELTSFLFQALPLFLEYTLPWSAHAPYLPLSLLQPPDTLEYGSRSSWLSLPVWPWAASYPMTSPPVNSGEPTSLVPTL